REHRATIRSAERAGGSHPWQGGQRFKSDGADGGAVSRNTRHPVADRGMTRAELSAAIRGLPPKAPSTSWATAKLSVRGCRIELGGCLPRRRHPRPLSGGSPIVVGGCLPRRR